MDENFITNTYVGIGTWRPYTIYRHSLYSNKLIGGLHCILKNPETSVDSFPTLEDIADGDQSRVLLI